MFDAVVDTPINLYQPSDHFVRGTEAQRRVGSPLTTMACG